MSTPEKRPVSFFSLFNRGQHYAKTWPLDKRLAPVFIENPHYLCHPLCHPHHRRQSPFLPLCWQIALGGQLGPAVATALFALSLPMQGLWWLA